MKNKDDRDRLTDIKNQFKFILGKLKSIKEYSAYANAESVENDY